MTWYKVPWHKNGAKPKEKLKLIVFPLCTSLLNFCVTLNILIYLLINDKIFLEYSLIFSYVSAVVSSTSFILFVLSIIYGNYIFLLCSAILQVILWMDLILIVVDFWMEKDLTSVNPVMFNLMKFGLSGYWIIMAFMEFKFGLFSIALGEAMYRSGISWDLDDMESVIT